MFLQMYGKSLKNSVDGHQIRSTIPYVRTDIPIIIVFRALGYPGSRTADRDIIEHIVDD